MGNFFFWIGIAAIGLLCIPPICDMLKTAFVYGGDRYGTDRAKFMEDARLAGMTGLQATDTLFLREVLARLRDRASDAVRADPALWFESLAREKREAVEYVAGCNGNLVTIFARQLDDLSYGHILYPAEARLVDKVMERNTGFNPTEYQRHAMRIVRPG